LDKNYRLKGIVPVYSLKGPLSQKVVRAAIHEALQKVNLNSVIPYPLRERYGLSSLIKAYYELHNPTSMQSKDDAAERVALEEYFVLISAFKLIKGGKEEARVHKYTVSAADVKEFATRFAFEFTDGQ
jgi:RecG-like helicase